jgi:hypothetical protein
MKKKIRIGRLLRILALPAILLALLLGCAREEPQLAATRGTDYAALARAWLAEHHPDLTVTLRWGEAHVLRQAGSTVLLDVPVSCEPGEYGTNPAVRQSELDERYYSHHVRLELAMNRTGEVGGAFIYTVVPTLADMERRNFAYEDVSYHLPQDLDGMMFAYGLHGEPMVMDRFAGGKLVGRQHPLPPALLDEYGKTFAKRMDYGGGTWGGGEWGHAEYGYCSLCGDYHFGELDEAAIYGCQPCWNCGDCDCWGGCWYPNFDDPDPVCQGCGRLLVFCICDSGVGSGGGGGNTNNNPPNPPNPPTPPTDPCSQAQSLTSDNTFKSAMQDLKAKTSQNREYAYYYANGGTPTLIAGNEGQGGIDMHVAGAIDVLAHSHYGTSLLSIFSGGDIYSLYQLLNNDLLNNPSTFTFSLITGQGTTYLLMIEDVEKFRTYGNDTFGGVTSGADADNELGYIYSAMGIVQGGDAAQNEIGFLHFLRTSNTGLSLFKGSSASFSSWDRTEIISTGYVFTLPCL